MIKILYVIIGLNRRGFYEKIDCVEQIIKNFDEFDRNLLEIPQEVC